MYRAEGYLTTFLAFNFKQFTNGMGVLAFLYESLIAPNFSKLMFFNIKKNKVLPM